jgi:hypothetical protein
MQQACAEVFAVVLSCMAHARRKFKEALDTGYKREYNKKVLSKNGQLYRLERFADKLDANTEKQYQLRQIYSRKILDEIKKLLTNLEYYHTLDGTNPENSPTRLQYTAPFTISSTTTIKAYAVVEGNPDWYPSEVMTRTYTKSGTVATNRNAAVPVAFNSFQTGNNATLFDISGRRISTNSLTAKQGIQLRKVGNTITRQVVLR